MMALREVANSAWPRMTPLIEAESSSDEGADPHAQRVLARLPGMLSQSLGASPCFVDLGSLTSRQEMLIGPAGDQSLVGVVDYLVDAFEARRLNCVPVVRSGMDPGTLRTVMSMTGNERGACLRLARAMRRGGLAGELSRLMSLVGTAPETTDVILDLRYLSPDEEFGPHDLAKMIERLPYLSDLRSLVVIGTTVPETLASFPRGCINFIPRRELQLWNALRSLPVRRLPTFGDYAVQHPDPPLSGGSAINMKVNIRYSTPDGILVARGESGKHEEYHQLAIWVVQRPEFRGDDYSWGDRRIGQAADGEGRPGNQTTWRAAGTSHHLQMMIDELSGAAAQPRIRRHA